MSDFEKKKQEAIYSVFDMLGEMTQEEFDRLIDEYTEKDKVNFPDGVTDGHKDNVFGSL